MNYLLNSDELIPKFILIGYVRLFTNWIYETIIVNCAYRLHNRAVDVRESCAGSLEFNPGMAKSYKQTSKTVRHRSNINEKYSTCVAFELYIAVRCFILLRATLTSIIKGLVVVNCASPSARNNILKALLSSLWS